MKFEKLGHFSFVLFFENLNRLVDFVVAAFMRKRAAVKMEPSEHLCLQGKVTRWVLIQILVVKRKITAKVEGFGVKLFGTGGSLIIITKVED